MSKGSKTFSTPAGDLPDNTIQRARIRRTRWYAEDREGFMIQLVNEIRRFKAKAERKGLVPVVRLNGTSDIQWELIPVFEGSSENIFEYFSELQFYDYTKIYKRFRRVLPSNYAICLSYSQASKQYAEACVDAHQRFKASLVYVVRDKEDKAMLVDAEGVDGDLHDLRFLEPKGSLIYLLAKGSAKRDTSGFVIG